MLSVRELMLFPDFVYNVLRTLRTSSIAAIVERLRPLLHIDPVAVLPPEIMAEIFSYLTPPMLLEASRASKLWRESTLDTRLWKQKFNLEGWGLDMNEVRTFEQRYNARRLAQSQMEKTRTDQQRQKKRSRAEVDGMEDSNSSRQPRPSSTSNAAQTWTDRREIRPARTSGVTVESSSNHDEEMYDVGSLKAITQANKGSSNNINLQTSSNDNRFNSVSEEAESMSNDREPYQSLDDSPEVERQDGFNSDLHLMMPTSAGYSRLNYHHVFKQKRKLEDNWNSGSYQSFQLPHRDHPEEAHTECVYTIQYLGNYLVSGSRDRTLRIWDLETQRLVREPLLGHTASVLCLQFDNQEKEDIIISGSSDTDVILWRFSTGELLQKISRAHQESVLNLKFDERFLVTCSKDKTIKIWNRREVQPGDRDYPVKGVEDGGKCPAYVVDLTQYGGSLNSINYLTPEQRQPLRPYTPLMLIDSHGAAVNAIHIHNDKLVSASGDRSVKVFDIHTGVCTAVCRGHTKGIACVQYDGKRIVSGSSDNTIRIYDPATQAEVACLQGHTRLVRTIQSAFGDTPGSREQLEQEALEVDRQYYKAERMGLVSDGSAPQGKRNAGSKEPQNIMAVGAKLPPGGGGSKWGRIISGSYDETIIIWKKAADGRWLIGHRLRQEEALRAAGGPLVSHSDLQSPPQHSQLPSHSNDPTNGQQPPVPPHSSSGAPAASMASHHPVQHAMLAGAVAMSAPPPLTNHYPHLANPALNAQIHAYQQQLQQQLQQQTLQQQQQMVAVAAAAAAGHSSASNPNPRPTAAPTASHLQPAAQPPPALSQPVTNHHPATTASQPNARVFKLQFDARRIICCSQDPKIVGWDFANGDEKIVACSRFFASPQ